VSRYGDIEPPLQIHRSPSEPEKFFFYEVFRDEVAFADHQRADHCCRACKTFMKRIGGMGLPEVGRAIPAALM